MIAMLRKMRRIRRNMTSGAPVPLAVHVNITGRCPCRCWHCEKSVDRGGGDLDPAVMDDCLRLAAMWGSSILYSGGEPLAHPAWPSILRRGMELGVPQKMVTSGAGLGKVTAENRALLSVALDEMLVSIDAADSATHDRLRGRAGLFDEVTGWLRETPRPRRIWLVHVPDIHLAGVAPMIDLAASLGAGLIVQPYSFASNYPHLLPLAGKADWRDSMPDLASAVGVSARELASTAHRAGVPTNLGEVALFISAYFRATADGDWYGRALSPRFVCSVPWQQLTVDEHGRVQPCALLAGTSCPGDSDLEDHWRRQALSIRERLLRGEILPECRACTCHFSANLRNSAVARPWQNRSLLWVLATKRFRNMRFMRDPRERFS